MNKKCQWVHDDDDYDVWETKCGDLFILTEGTPRDNGMKFCPYCGKEIE